MSLIQTPVFIIIGLKMEDNTNQVTYSLIDSVNFTPTVVLNQNSIAALSYIADNDIVIS